VTQSSASPADNTEDVEDEHDGYGADLDESHSVGGVSRAAANTDTDGNKKKKKKKKKKTGASTTSTSTSTGISTSTSVESSKLELQMLWSMKHPSKISVVTGYRENWGSVTETALGSTPSSGSRTIFVADTTSDLTVYTVS
jgi:hypothetical protein